MKTGIRVLILFTFFLLLLGNEDSVLQNVYAEDGDLPLDRVTLYGNGPIPDELSKDFFDLYQDAWIRALNYSDKNFELKFKDTIVKVSVIEIDGGISIRIEFPEKINGRSIPNLFQVLGKKQISDVAKGQLGITNQLIANPGHFRRTDFDDDYNALTKSRSLVSQAELQRDSIDNIRRVQKAFLDPVDQLQVLDEVRFLYGKLVNRWKELETANPNNFKEEWIDTNKVHVDSTFGRAELNSIDGQPFVRVVHKGTGIAFGIFKGLDPENPSDHFIRYVSRQHIVANSDQPKLKDRGRDFVYLSVDDFVPVDDPEDFINADRFHVMRRPTPYSKDWWLAYWNAIRKRPNKSMLTFGFLCAFSHSVLASGLAFGTQAIFGELPISPATIGMVTFAWGSAFGSMGSMFHNWVKIGPESAQRMKNALNGYLFKYVITAMATGGLDFMLNPVNHALIYAASKISSYSKQNWKNFAILREKLGIVHGEYKLAGFTFKKNHIDRELMYLPKFGTNFSERLLNSVSPLPIGTPLLISSIPFSEFMLLRYARKKMEESRKFTQDGKPHPDATKIYNKVRHSWEMKKRLVTDPDIMLNLMESIDIDREIRQRARSFLAEEMPSLFGPNRKKLKSEIESYGNRPVPFTRQGPCISELLQLIRI